MRPAYTKFPFILALFALSSTTYAGEDWLLIPGKRAGAIDSKATLQVLKGTYGSENVLEDSCGSEDEPSPCIKIRKSGIDVAVIYDDEKERTVVISKGDWHTENGLKLGSSIGEVEKNNGKPIGLWRFDWDFKAEAKSWNNGKLAKPFENRLLMRFSQKNGFSAYKNDKVNSDLKKHLLDVDPDNVISSNDSSVMKLGLQIFEFVLILKR
ncbi:MAG: hypothetical protein ACXVCH_07525 [Bdellovibrionota bacterium]